MFNFIYSSSNMYAPYCLTSMSSLLKNNTDLNECSFYILSNDISFEMKMKMESLCNRFNAKLYIVDCCPVIETIFAGGGILNFNPSSFLRIFIPQILPKIDKALFIDSDTYIYSGIKELYETDISEFYCAMSYNMPIYKEMLEEAKMDPMAGYFNAGVILLNLRAWREDNIQHKILQFYYENGGNFPTDDQSVINAIVADKTYVLPYKYNAMIGAFYWSYKKFCSINTKIGRKTKEEFFQAKKNPVIVHFHGPGVRPWEKWCGHPYADTYLEELLKNNPDYRIALPKGRMVRIIGQYFKHTVVDRLECFFHR